MINNFLKIFNDIKTILKGIYNDQQYENDKKNYLLV